MSGDNRPDFGKLAAEYRQVVKPDVLGRLATALGVSVESLRRLGIGWLTERQAWTFPMQDADGNVLGIRLRLRFGDKLAVKGGREGLFIPSDLDAAGRLLIAEGPTDTAALLDLGFDAVGRPSCTGGVRLLVDAVRKWKPSGVVIVADVDADGVGQRGAESLAAVLRVYSAVVRIITPPAPFKDVRAWRQGGAAAGDVQRAIDATAERKLSFTIRQKARKWNLHRTESRSTRPRSAATAGQR